MTVGLWRLSSLDGRRPPWYRPLSVCLRPSAVCARQLQSLPQTHPSVRQDRNRNTQSRCVFRTWTSCSRGRTRTLGIMHCPPTSFTVSVSGSAGDDVIPRGKYRTRSATFLNIHRLAGLLVRASASRAEDQGFESSLRWNFFRVESYKWQKIGNLQ